MLYRKLGSSGIDVSAVGFGAWAIGGWMWGGTDENQAVAAIHAALDHGVNLIDTAPAYGYGLSEQIVGRAIQGRRQHVVLATKCGLVWDREEGTFFFHSDQQGITSQPSEKKFYKNLRPASIRREVEQSLRNLGTDYLDLLQTHWQDPSTPLAETVAELGKLKQEGKIRAIGVSNCSLDDLRAYGPIDSDQEKYSMLDRNIERNGVLAWCREQGIAVLAYSPLANGLLTGKMPSRRQFNAGDLRRANPRFRPTEVERINAQLAKSAPLAQRHGATTAQLVIAWTFSQPGLTVALCGARDPQQAIENAAAGDIALSAEELQAMNELFGG
jgi:aryl-alcohol dehydrogenase-like predicted oxidoreductase